jgi:hypothetical protein
VDLYIHSPILLHGVVHNDLNTGKSIRFTMNNSREIMSEEIIWLVRNYATSRKIAGFRPDEVNEFFQCT